MLALTCISIYFSTHSAYCIRLVHIIQLRSSFQILFQLIVWVNCLNKLFIADKRLVKYLTMANCFSAMDLPAAVSIPPVPEHHVDREQVANKEAKTSRSIITYNHR